MKMMKLFLFRHKYRELFLKLKYQAVFEELVQYNKLRLRSIEAQGMSLGPFFREEK